MYLDPIQFPLAERMLRKSAAPGRDDSSALKLRCQPIAYLHLTVHPIDLVRANGSSEFALAPDPGRHAFIVRELLQASANEFQNVIDAGRLIHPRQPLPQIRAIPLYGVENNIGMPLLDESQVDIVLNRYSKHVLPPATFPPSMMEL